VVQLTQFHTFVGAKPKGAVHLLGDQLQAATILATPVLGSDALLERVTL
jgi:hypothetical protein